MENEEVIALWDSIAAPYCEPDLSLQLLKELVSLWATIRTYSFAKMISQQEAKKKLNKHGTRKTLLKSED